MHVNVTQNQLFIYIREQSFIGMKMKCKCNEKFSIVCLATANLDHVGRGRGLLTQMFYFRVVLSLYLYFQYLSVFYFWSRRSLSKGTAEYGKKHKWF